MLKKCMPLWRDAHLQVKVKHLTFGPALEVETSKKRALLWREAHFEVKMYKAHHARTTFGKKCTPLWREAHFEVKMYKAHHARTTFGGSDVEKVHAVVARSTFRSENVQSTRGSDHFWRFRCSFCVAGARDSVPCQKGFRTLHFQKQWHAWDISRRSAKMHVAGQAQYKRHVHQRCSLGLLRWFCVTGAALRMTWHHFFVAGAALQRHGHGLEKFKTRRSPSALHSTFHCFRRNCQPYPGDDSNIYFVIFLRFFVFFLSFQFCLSFVLSFFCRFSFVCLFFCRFSVLACCFFVVIWWKICHMFCHFLAMFVRFSQKDWRISKNYIPKKWPKKWQCFEKKHFLQPEKLSFCLSFFVIWSKICHFFSFFVILVPFSQKYGKYRQLFEKWQKMTNNDKQNDRPKLKWQKMTNKMTDKIEMTKKMTDKTDMTKNDTQNDKQTEMTTKMTKKWQIKYFVFFNLCLPKFLLTIVEGRWRKSPRIASFLMLSISKSRGFTAFLIFSSSKSWGGLAE